MSEIGEITFSFDLSVDEIYWPVEYSDKNINSRYFGLEFESVNRGSIFWVLHFIRDVLETTLAHIGSHVILYFDLNHPQFQ